ncbi:MAG: hypothetical protein ACQESP_04650 [Candidatus Muiribacteriota bacterium]
MANISVDKNSIKRGDIIGKDVLSDGKIIVDKNTVLNYYFIQNIKKAPDVNEVELEEKEFVEPPEPKDFKIHPVDDLIEKLYLADWEIDKELEILKNVKALTKKFNERTVEGLDFVISYFHNTQGRKIAAEGINKIGYREFYPIAIMALLDEEQVVRNSVYKYFLKFKEDQEIITELINKYNYVDDNNKSEYMEVMTKMIKKIAIEKVQQKAAQENNSKLLEACKDILNQFPEK